MTKATTTPKPKKKKECHQEDGGVIVNTDPTPIGQCPRGFIWNGTKCVKDVG